MATFPSYHVRTIALRGILLGNICQATKDSLAAGGLLSCRTIAGFDRINHAANLRLLKRDIFLPRQLADPGKNLL